jgi:REP element-mobilizing transposase RayT
MPRANRYFLPGYIWHITHRCHKREFLLKFNRDKKRWISWLFEAKKRYGLCVLNYMATDNHIHLLVMDNGNHECIPKSIQLVAGRTGQEFNQRKNRKGAFWEDRYHATAVARADYLMQCMDYIDMNMVRAGVVYHPAEWPFCGYHELMLGKQRYRLINSEKLAQVLGVASSSEMPTMRQRSIKALLKKEDLQRQRKWTESIAVGSQTFVETVKDKLGFRAKTRFVHQGNENHELREAVVPYSTIFSTENDALSPNIGLFWDVYIYI